MNKILQFLLFHYFHVFSFPSVGQIIAFMAAGDNKLNDGKRKSEQKIPSRPLAGNSSHCRAAIEAQPIRARCCWSRDLAADKKRARTATTNMAASLRHLTPERNWTEEKERALIAFFSSTSDF